VEYFTLHCVPTEARQKLKHIEIQHRVTIDSLQHESYSETFHRTSHAAVVTGTSKICWIDST